LSPAVRAGIGRAIDEAQEGVAAFNEKRAPDFEPSGPGVQLVLASPVHCSTFIEHC
jgi:hypothetical protein